MGEKWEWIFSGNLPFVTHARLALHKALISCWVIHHDTKTGQMFHCLNTSVLISTLLRFMAAKYRLGNKNGTLLVFSWQVLNLDQAFLLSNYGRSLQKASALAFTQTQWAVAALPVLNVRQLRRPRCPTKRCISEKLIRCLRQRRRCWRFAVIPGGAERAKKKTASSA